MNEEHVQSSWQQHPCGDMQVGDGPERFGKYYRTFFGAYDAFTNSYKTFMHSPPLPVHGFPGGKIMGCHLWVYMRPV